MSIANDIREAVLCELPSLHDPSDVCNKIVSAFMQRGDWLNCYTHAVTFALFVAEALDDGASGVLVDAPTRWCPECRSAGVVGIEQDVCPTCDGTGRVAARGVAAPAKEQP